MSTHNSQQQEILTLTTQKQYKKMPRKYLKTALILIALLVFIILSSINIIVLTSIRTELSESIKVVLNTLDAKIDSNHAALNTVDAKIDSNHAALKTLDAKIDSNHAALSNSIEDIDMHLFSLSARLFPSIQISPIIYSHVCVVAALTAKCVGDIKKGSLGIDPSLLSKTSTPFRN